LQTEDESIFDRLALASAPSIQKKVRSITGLRVFKR
jgi:hypothetical protein